MNKGMVVAALALALLVSRQGEGQAQTVLRTVGFPGANNVQTWVAQERGFFAKEGLDVRFDVTKGSVAEIKDLMAGKYQVMTTDFDNVIADIEGQGEHPVPDAADLVAFMGVHSGLESLVTSPDITKLSQLRGKTVAVDAARSGYALLMYRLLEQAGLKPGDYKVAPVGGTPFRREALTQGRASAVMLSPPVDEQLAAKGYHVLAKSSDLGPGQGSVYVARRSWMAGHKKEIDGYIRAIVAATDAIFADKAQTIAVLKAHLPDAKPATLDALYQELIGPDGLDPKAKINIAGVKTILAIRGEFGEPRKVIGEPSKYIDEALYQSALAQP